MARVGTGWYYAFAEVQVAELLAALGRSVWQQVLTTTRKRGTVFLRSDKQRGERAPAVSLPT